MGHSLLSIVVVLLWSWAIFDCYQNEPDRDVWMWVVVFGSIVGALIYFVVRRLPALVAPNVPALNRLVRGKELRSAEYDAQYVGGAYQYAKLGALQAELKWPDKAKQSFQKAIEKDPKNLEALWGMSQVYDAKGDFAEGLPLLERLVSIDSNYLMGAGLVAYGRTLHVIGRQEDAQQVLLRYFEGGGYMPTGRILLAEILYAKGDTAGAQKHLARFFEYMDDAAPAEYSLYEVWVSKAKHLQSKLSK